MKLSHEIMFDSDGLAQDLAGKSVRGGVATLGAQVGRTALAMLAIVVLARLLSPDDFGLIGMATVVIGLARMFKDAGLATATVQKETITHEQISSLFWLNLAVSLALAAAVLISAPFVATFFSRPELGPVTAALSVSFLIGGVSIQHEALLRRHMRFRALGVAQVLSQAMNTGTAILAAFLGMGYWSLVVGTLTSSLSLTLAALWYCPWVPGRFHRGSGIKSMAVFGGNVMGFNFANYFARNADYVLIGRFIGADALGLYTKAYELFMLPVVQIRAPLNDVALPAMSSLKSEPEKYAAYYGRLLKLLAILTVPITAYCLIEAEFIIDLLLGEQWTAAVPVFRILATAGLITAVASTRGLVLLSLGLSHKYLRLGVVHAAVMVASFVIGLPYGIEGVAVAYAIANLVFLFPSLLYTFSGTPVRVGDFLGAVIRPLMVGALSGIVTMAVLAILPRDGLLPHVVAFLTFWGVYIGASALSRDVRQTIRQIVGHMGDRLHTTSEGDLDG